jgi:hypothetical protein
MFLVLNFLPPVKAPPNQEFGTQNAFQQTDRCLHVKGAQSVAAWSLVLAALVVGITVCVAIGYIVFLQPNPDSNVPDLPPSDAVVKTPPDETSSTSLSLSPSSKPENASEATSVDLPARCIQNEPPS